MSLPDAWVDRIFERLTLTYGRQFLSRWEGLDLLAVKADWAQHLSGFQQNPDAIRYGLDHLPADQPPTVVQFAAVCRRYAPAAAPQLPAPKPTPERLAQHLAALGTARPNRAAIEVRVGTAWARALHEVHEGRLQLSHKKPLTQAQVAMYRRALRMDSAPTGDFGLEGR